MPSAMRNHGQASGDSLQCLHCFVADGFISQTGQIHIRPSRQIAQHIPRANSITAIGWPGNSMSNVKDAGTHRFLQRSLIPCGLVRTLFLCSQIVQLLATIMSEDISVRSTNTSLCPLQGLIKTSVIAPSRNSVNSLDNLGAIVFRY